MTHITEQITVATVENGAVSCRLDTLVVETACTLKLNGTKIHSSVCSPDKLFEFAYGFLITEGIVKPGVKPVFTDGGGGVVNANTGSFFAPQELQKVSSGYTVTPAAVLGYAAEFAEAGDVFRETGATHSAAVFAQDGIKCFTEDVSRSAALNKVVGSAFVNGVNTSNSVLVLSSRVHSRFVEKSARAGFPIVVAISAPTAQAAERAHELGICLCGFVRGKRMNVYSCSWRLGL
jgi:FdhD protein